MCLTRFGLPRLRPWLFWRTRNRVVLTLGLTRWLSLARLLLRLSTFRRRRIPFHRARRLFAARLRCRLIIHGCIRALRRDVMRMLGLLRSRLIYRRTRRILRGRCVLRSGRALLGSLWWLIVLWRPWSTVPLLGPLRVLWRTRSILLSSFHCLIALWRTRNILLNTRLLVCLRIAGIVRRALRRPVYCGETGSFGLGRIERPRHRRCHNSGSSSSVC